MGAPVARCSLEFIVEGLLPGNANGWKGSTPACRCSRKRTHAEMCAVEERLRLSAATTSQGASSSKAAAQP
jgi:hypothetical protein